MTGGAEQVTVAIVNGLSAGGHDVELVVSDLRGRLAEKISPDVTVTELGPILPGLGIATHVPALARYLQRVQPAIIFPQMTHASVVCLAANRLVDVDTVIVPVKHCAFGESPSQTTKGRALEYLAIRLFPTADHVVGVSQGVLDSMVERMALDPAEMSVLHNPVDIGAIREQAASPVDHEWIEDDDLDVVVFVGRHEEQKDLETWLRAFAEVHESNPNTRGVLAGTGSQRERLLNLAETLGIGDVVSFPGYVENPYRYMYRASVFMLSSRFEGLPTVLIEALACGTQIVATDCPSGPREILLEGGGVCGRLAPVGDASGLAAAVLETLRHPLPEMSLRQRAADFTPEVVLGEYERFIERQVGGRRYATSEQN
ncbi:glycosyltransferase [Halobellus rarus]|uniref:Glycosyltransferase n=1 Tax=Halobellus rarus TaxID=1126237 RepID=A0ABD6CJE5_9EURY|nr:glycosyltransferase [Halobellus rarus]